jgi:stress response protein YsnF
MSEETIVAMYDTPAHAEAAIRDLKAADVPPNAISSHAEGGVTGGTTAAPAREPGFWASLFGGETTDSATFDRSLASGATVVTVKVPEQHKSRVVEILERHDPVDFDDRTASYGAAQTTTTRTETVTAAPVAMAVPRAAVVAKNDDTIKVMEERLVVGKRAVNNGGARIRSYVVETPVEEQVSLHSETVHIERRPVTDGRVVTDADFAERSVEMTERHEEAVVGKEARVVEEISLRKKAGDSGAAAVLVVAVVVVVVAVWTAGTSSTSTLVERTVSRMVSVRSDTSLRMPISSTTRAVLPTTASSSISSISMIRSLNASAFRAATGRSTAWRSIVTVSSRRVTSSDTWVSTT